MAKPPKQGLLCGVTYLYPSSTESECIGKYVHLLGMYQKAFSLAWYDNSLSKHFSMCTRQGLAKVKYLSSYVLHFMHSRRSFVKLYECRLAVQVHTICLDGLQEFCNYVVQVS